jgi:branched-chain amino acid transport system substrate-binding protein
MEPLFRPAALALACAAALVAMGAAPARADDTILFGAPLAATGRDAREGALTREGYDFWKDYVNAHGGLSVGGKKYKVDIRYYDDESNPQTTARLTERLIDQDKANFILGPYGSAPAFAAAAVVERKKVPMVEGNGSAEKIFSQGFTYTFAVLSPAKRYLEGVVDMALHMKPRPQTVAITAANDLFSLEVAQGAADFAKAHGLNVVYFNKYPADTTDVSAIVSAIKAAKPDLFLNGGHLQDALLLERGLKEQDVDAMGYGYSVGPDTPDFRKILGNDANYVFGAAQWSISAKYKGAPGFISSSQEYAKQFAAKYHHDPDYHNAESTATCLAFQYAITRANSLDPKAVRDGLAALDVTTFYGLLKFDSRGINVYKPMVVNQIQRGELKTVWPSAAAVSPPMWPAPAWGKR